MITVIFPKDGQMGFKSAKEALFKFAEKASRSNKFPIFWAADHISIPT
jgi:hypothetical protein